MTEMSGERKPWYLERCEVPLNDPMKITEIKIRCKACGHRCTVGDTEPGEEGELLCPECGEEIVVRCLTPPAEFN